MKKLLAILILVLVNLSISEAAYACPPPHPNSNDLEETITSIMPAKSVPKGAIQLQVIAPSKEDEYVAINETGKISLQVKKVLNGKFASSSLLLNITNLSMCDDFHAWLERPGDVYVTALPLKYKNGESVVDSKGRHEFAPLFYRVSNLHSWDTGERPKIIGFRDDLNYDYNLYDPERLMCLEGVDNPHNKTEELWHKCVAPGQYVMLSCKYNNYSALICEQDDSGLGERPADLRRGYIPWGGYGAVLAIFLTLLIALYEFIAFKRKYS